MKGNKIALTFCLCIFCFITFDTIASELKFVTQEFEPFHQTEGKIVSGPGAEIVRLVCQKMKTACSIRSFPWTRAQYMMRKGEAHAMLMIGRNREREKWLWFSHPLIRTQYGFFVREDDPLQFKKTSDIKAYNVGVYGPSNTSRSLERIKEEVKDMSIDMSVHDEFCFKKLPIGRVDAVYSNRDVGLSLISKLKLKNLRYAGMHKELDYYVGFAMEHNDKETVDKFNAAFMELYKNGKIKEVLARYNMNPSTIE